MSRTEKMEERFWSSHMQEMQTAFIWVISLECSSWAFSSIPLLSLASKLLLWDWYSRVLCLLTFLWWCLTAENMNIMAFAARRATCCRSFLFCDLGATFQQFLLTLRDIPEYSVCPHWISILLCFWHVLWILCIGQWSDEEAVCLSSA